MSKLHHAFTKIHKSWTLMFNWLLIVVLTIAEVATQFAPELRSILSTEVYAYVVLGANILLRLKTTSALEHK